MSTEDEDLKLLLSLEDRVLETPPGSPACTPPLSPGYLSDDGGVLRQREHSDLSVFRDVVQDCIDYVPNPIKKDAKKCYSKNSEEPSIDKYSGLRIRNQTVSMPELYERFADIRFVRLEAMINLLEGDILSGCWATVGVLSEKGKPRTSSVGQSYCIWKLGCLGERTVSLFLFGNAYQQNLNESEGTVFALFNCNVRRDNAGSGFSLSICTPNQVLKIGTSADYGVCKGKRKDGMPCTLVINKRRGIYCSYHKIKTSEQYTTLRSELMGGNLKHVFKDNLKSRGVHLVDPLADRTNLRNQKLPVKLQSLEALKKALSNADKGPAYVHSQGLRILKEVAGELDSKTSKKFSANVKQTPPSVNKRASSAMGIVHQSSLKTLPKRTKPNQELVSMQKAAKGSEKMIELELYSSDEET